MFIKIKSAEQLGKMLATCGTATGGDGDANPLQTTLLLIAEGEQLAVIAADTSSHQLKLVMPATVNIAGRILIPPGHFSKVMSRLGQHEVSLRVENNMLVVSSNANDVHNFQLYQGEASDFPLDTDYPPIVARVESEALVKELKAVMVPALNSEQEITFYGLDGTLSIYTAEYVTFRSRFALLEQADPFLFGVHKSALSKGRLPVWSGSVNIHVSEDKVMFSKGDEHLILRGILHETDVTQYDDILDMQAMGTFVVSSSVFHNRVQTIAYDKQISCSLQVIGKTDPKSLVVSAEHGGAPTSKMFVPIQGPIRGGAKDVNIDALLLDKALSSIDGDDTKVDLIDYNGNGTEIFVRLSNDSNPDKRQAVIVPLQQTV